MWYIFKDGNCNGFSDSKVNDDDLATRNETVVEDSNVYDISKIKLENNKIVQCDLSDADKLAVIRDKRDQLLKNCDWTQLTDTALTNVQKQAWVTYRQALRDMPNNVIDLDKPTWPIIRS